MNIGIMATLSSAINRLIRIKQAGAPSSTADAFLIGEELKHVQQYCERITAERDALFIERGNLLVKLQAATRPGGLAAHGAFRPAIMPFPQTALTRGQYPRLSIVDIGAQQLSFEEHAYQRLLDLKIADVIGFEPLQKHADHRASNDPSVCMLNYFVGNGENGIFRTNSFDPTSSLFPTNFALLDRFYALSDMCRTLREDAITTTRLDDVSEISDCDYLKIDVQGGELDVLLGAPILLEKILTVHCEVEFAEVYSKQPLFGDIDQHLRNAGFELIDMQNAGYATTRDLPGPLLQSRLLWSEAIYFKTPAKLRLMDEDKKLKAALIAHANYGMYDIAVEFLRLIENQNGPNLAELYLKDIFKPGNFRVEN